VTNYNIPIETKTLYHLKKRILVSPLDLSLRDLSAPNSTRAASNFFRLNPSQSGWFLERYPAAESRFTIVNPKIGLTILFSISSPAIEHRQANKFHYRDQ
jgi:hypothetical protein